MKNIIKTDFKRALKGAKFPLAIILMFFVWESTVYKGLHRVGI